jgi:hypothetical protein
MFEQTSLGNLIAAALPGMENECRFRRNARTGTYLRNFPRTFEFQDYKDAPETQTGLRSLQMWWEFNI